MQLHSLQFALLLNHNLNLISICNKHILILPVSDLKILDSPIENNRKMLFPGWDCSWKDKLKYLCKSLIASTLGGLLWGLSWISGYEVCRTLSVCGCCLHFFLSALSLFRLPEHWVLETYKMQARCVDNSGGTCHWSKWQRPDSSNVSG